MEHHAGDRVVWGGEIGVVLSADAESATVSMPSAGVITVAAAELTPYASDPVQQLVSASLGEPDRYILRLQAEFLRHAYRFDPLAGLSNARVEPKHHQVYVAHRVTRKSLPRMILADEVGLGKTIEAGLILKELRAREGANRTLVVVPANLRSQWQHELAAKFNDEFLILDGDAARHFGRDGSNPFQASDSVICSLSFASRKERREQISALHWDVVIFDEAHRVRAGPSGRTRAYELADRIKHDCTGMLLLTATPMQLNQYDLWALIDLVEPGLYPSPADYERVRSRFPDLNRLMKQVKSWTALPHDERTQLLQSAPKLLEEAGLEPDVLHDLDDPETREVVLDRIAAEHHLADVLVRNRRADVGGFTTRNARQVPVDMTPAEEDAYEAVTEYLRNTYNLVGGGNSALGFLMVTYHKMLASSSAAIYASLKRRIAALQAELEQHRNGDDDAWSSEGGADRREVLEASDAVVGLEAAHSPAMALETEIGILEGLVAQVGKLRDSKARRLVELADEILGNDPEEKLLIFTQYLETQRLLVRALKARGWSVDGFNGKMGPAEKDAAVERFRRSTQILVSTEAGGEGRNLQFCHLMCNYDLPWNPMKVEQRIGRVDRIGQERPVVIYNFANAGTIEERVLHVLDKRIRLFEESVGSLDPILGEVEQDIEALALLATSEREERFDQLEDDIHRRVREALDAEETLRDFALERNSFRQDETNELLDRRTMASPDDLQAFVDQVLRYEGGVLTEEVDGRSAITLSDALQRRLRRRESLHRGTFDPAIAVREETWEFFAMGHELIDDLLAAARDGTEGLTGVRVSADAPSTVGVELIYEIVVGGLQHRGELLRHVVGPDLEVISGQVTQQFSSQTGNTLAVVPDWSSAAVSASREQALQRRLEIEQDSLGDLDALRRARRERAERVHEHKVAQIRNATERIEETIAGLEASDDEEQRRILPALRGRVRNNRQRLNDLDQELAEQKAEIADLRPQVSLRTVAAGLVVPG